jgi:DNA-binding NtrC family response regulator
VDDELGVRHLICQLLQREGFATLEAGHGREALELLADRRSGVSLVLTDVRMPFMNGIQLEQAIRDEWPDLPVVLMSGEATREWIVRLVNESRLSIIRKPFACEELLETIRRRLDSGGQPRVG